MPFIKWDDKYLIGFNIIDDAQKKFVAGVNELHDAVKANRGNEVFIRFIYWLADYVSKSLKHEENIMEQHGYPDIDVHISEHEMFTREINDYFFDFETGVKLHVDEILEFLEKWVKSHLMEFDQEFGAFLVAKGVVPRFKKLL
ncbi:MAG: hemerythrin [Ignavibacteria bacterium]|nr:hemerythrin [Ignavibacteria bacterium]